MFLLPNPEDIQLFSVGLATASGTVCAARCGKNHVHGMGFQNHSGTHWLTISPSFMNLVFDPAFTHITKVMLTVSNRYFAHNIIFKNGRPTSKASLRQVATPLPNRGTIPLF